MPERAGLIYRFLAFVIDWLITSAFGFILSAVVILNLDGNKLANTPIEALVEPTIIMATIVTFIYLSTEVILCGTPGKLMLGLRIGTSDGLQASKGRLLLRVIAKRPDLLIALGSLAWASYEHLVMPSQKINQLVYLTISYAYFLSFISPMFIIFTNKLALHDIFCRTAVVKGTPLTESEYAEYKTPHQGPSADDPASLAINQLIFK